MNNVIGHTLCAWLVSGVLTAILGTTLTGRGVSR
jgi:hypothetical protein